MIDIIDWFKFLDDLNKIPVKETSEIKDHDSEEKE